MSFGFSVGDFIAVGGVITDIVSCLKDSTGSKPDYQELVRELEALDRALKNLDKLKPTGSSPSAVDSIKCAALSCRVPLEQFLSKIRKYESTLGPRASLSSVASSSKAVVQKIKWLSKADDIDRLRKYLDVHLGTINILLLEHGLQTLDVTSKAMQEQYGDMQNSLRAIDRVVTSTARNVESQTALVRTSHGVLGALFSMISGDIKSSISRIARFAQNASLLSQKIFEAVVQLQLSVSTISVDTRWTYFQPPIKVEDALGRVFPVPSEYSMCELHALLRSRFRKGPGHQQVENGDFKLIDRRNRAVLDRVSMPELLPGLDIVMSIFVEDALGRDCDVCPVAQCTSQNTIPVNWGGRTCLDCGRWFDNTFDATPRATKKRRIEEVTLEDDDSDKSQIKYPQQRAKRAKRNKSGLDGSGSSNLGYIRNISCLRGRLAIDLGDANDGGIPPPWVITQRLLDSMSKVAYLIQQIETLKQQGWDLKQWMESWDSSRGGEDGQRARDLGLSCQLAIQEYQQNELWVKARWSRIQSLRHTPLGISQITEDVAREYSTLAQCQAQMSQLRLNMLWT